MFSLQDKEETFTASLSHEAGQLRAVTATAATTTSIPVSHLCGSCLDVYPWLRSSGGDDDDGGDDDVQFVFSARAGQCQRFIRWKFNGLTPYEDVL